MNSEDFSELLAPKEPWLLKIVCTRSDVTDRLWSFQRKNRGSVIRFLRGEKMRTVQGLYDEFVAAWQFPDYFGYNGAAFDECLTDLSWLPATTYVLAIFDSAELLAQESKQLSLFLDAFERICMEWGVAVASGEAWDRDPVPFHVVFHCSPEDVPRLPPRIAALRELTGGKLLQ